MNRPNHRNNLVEVYPHYIPSRRLYEGVKRLSLTEMGAFEMFSGVLRFKMEERGGCFGY